MDEADRIDGSGGTGATEVPGAPAGLELLAPDVERQITRWWPQGLERVQLDPPAIAFCRQAVRAWGPPNKAHSGQALATAYRYVCWRLERGLALALDRFRLHRTNQGGFRTYGDHLFVDGRPCCPCAAYALEHRSFPTYPYTGAEISEYQLWAARRARFEMSPNGAWRADGGRQFFSVHFDQRRAAGTAPGGCEHCVDHYGDAVIDPETGLPRPRCCTQRTKKLSAAHLGLYQEASFGSKEWFDRWNPRNRVEGSYGVLKNLALVNWGRDYHHFVGLARESVVAAFAVMAYNFHVQETFAAKLARAAERHLAEEALRRRSRRRRPKTLALPSSQPTRTVPGGAATDGENSPPGPRPQGPRVLG